MKEATQGGGGSVQPGGSAHAQHPPMNQATQGGTASPQDLQSKLEGAQHAEGARKHASVKSPSTPSLRLVFNRDRLDGPGSRFGDP
jgi:hypothetical protein